MNVIPGAGPAQPPLRCYYRDYFNDPANDPFSGDYTESLAPYSVAIANQNAMVPAQVQELALSCQSQNVPTAFLLLLPDGKLHVFVQLSRFAQRMGLPQTQWDNVSFAQKGDLFHNQAQMVVWEPDYFHQVAGQIRVGTAATIDTALAGDPDAIFLGPYDDADAGTELIRVRRTCYVPPSYVPLLLGGPMSPRDAWQVLRGQLQVEGNELSCKPLVDFLRAAITLSQANPLLPLLSTPAPAPPLADEQLMLHRRRIVEHDFPLLNSNHSAVQQNQIAQQLGILITDNRQNQELADVRRAESKVKPLSLLIGERGVAILLRICNVVSEEDLPPFWREFASAPKSQQLAVLQFAIDDKKRDSVEPEIQFIATVNLLTLLKTLAFESNSVNSVGSGFDAFLFYEQLEQEAYEASVTWEALMDGSAGATTADLAPLLKAKVKPPLCDMDVRHMHRRLQIISQVVLGDFHDVPVNTGTFLVRYSSMESTLSRLEMAQPQHLRYTMICRKNSLILSAWFKRRKLHAGPMDGPNFDRFFQDVEEDNNWEQRIPAPVLKQLGLAGFQSPSGGPGVGLLPGAGGGGVVDPPPGGGNNGPPRGPPLAPGLNRNGLPINLRLNNTAFNPLFTVFKNMAGVSCKSVKEKIRSGALPVLPLSKVEPAKSICLAWHTRAECNTNCSCFYDHVTTYTDAELQPLHAWCTEHFHE